MFGTAGAAGALAASRCWTGEIRSAFCMTEPDVASSDATNIATRIERDGDEYVINGRKWWSSGAMNPRCEIFIVMGKTDPDGRAAPPAEHDPGAAGHPGRRRSRRGMTRVRLRRRLARRARRDRLRPTYGCRPATCSPARATASRIAQARLGPGRIHHCMRLIGMAERALELMCRRVAARVAFGKPLAEQGVVQEWIAESRVRIEQARLLVLKTAWLMDTVGNKGAHTEIQAIKIVDAGDGASGCIDKAIQAHGGGGRQPGLPAGRAVGGGPHAAPGRRPGRGAQDVAGQTGAAQIHRDERTAMPEAVIVATARSPIGRASRGR